MTINEFKAWFEGFTAAFERDSNAVVLPSVSQWLAIKAKLASIGSPTNPLAERVRKLQEQPPTTAYNGNHGQSTSTWCWECGTHR